MSKIQHVIFLWRWEVLVITNQQTINNVIITFNELKKKFNINKKKDRQSTHPQEQNVEEALNVTNANTVNINISETISICPPSY